MAAEIKALDGNGAGEYRVLFLYPIAAPKQVGGSNVVPTPAPTEGVIADLLSAGEVNALNTGTSAYEVINYGPSPTKTGAELVAELQTLYVDRKAAFDADYASRYKYIGTEVDAA